VGVPWKKANDGKRGGTVTIGIDLSASVLFLEFIASFFPSFLPSFLLFSLLCIFLRGLDGFFFFSFLFFYRYRYFIAQSRPQLSTIDKESQPHIRYDTIPSPIVSNHIISYTHPPKTQQMYHRSFHKYQEPPFPPDDHTHTTLPPHHN